jgi:hypothetical protein
MRFRTYDGCELAYHLKGEGDPLAWPASATWAV